VEKVARKFRSFAEADKANCEFYQSLTPEQRLDILGELIKQKYPNWANGRIERIGRKIKLLSRSPVGTKSL
jgi:hypothetical protein